MAGLCGLGGCVAEVVAHLLTYRRPALRLAGRWEASAVFWLVGRGLGLVAFGLLVLVLARLGG